MSSKSHKTAISRKTLSRPARLFRSRFEGKVLDFGCGRGDDADTLKIDKYDPHYFPVLPDKLYDTVTLIYVLNTVEYPRDVVKEAVKKVAPGGLLMVATRTVSEVRSIAKKSNWEAHGRGWRTGLGTFQRGLSVGELCALLPTNFEVLETGTKDFSYIVARRKD